MNFHVKIIVLKIHIHQQQYLAPYTPHTHPIRMPRSTTPTTPTTPTITEWRNFHLARIPWHTLGLILLLSIIHIGWFFYERSGTISLLEKGAKNGVLLDELGEWWRLLSANLIHTSHMHLAFNLLFLFNIGGPVEAIFHRLDYWLIVLASALGGAFLSYIGNPITTCGASGIVFGLWGAAATFGLQYYRYLPKKYLRYFIGMVLPYAIFTLGVGLLMPNIDNLGHLGGLIAGIATALCLSPRTQCLKPHHKKVKRGLLIAVPTMIILISFVNFEKNKTQPLPLYFTPHRLQHRIEIALPDGWKTLMNKRWGNRTTSLFGNQLGVGVTLESRLGTTPLILENEAQEYLSHDLPAQLKEAAVDGVTIHPPRHTILRNTQEIPAVTWNIEYALGRDIISSTYYIILSSDRRSRYTLAFHAPRWLYKSYLPTFEAMRNELKWGGKAVQ